MSDPRQISRRVYTHNALLGAANRFRRLAEEPEGQFDAAMASALFCALALEAALNHVGACLVPVWDDHLRRRLNPEGKLALIASVAGRPIDFGSKPFQAFKVLFGFRNQLAHGTTQDLSYEKARHWVTYGDQRWPAAQWETLCTREHAVSLVEDTERIIETLLRLPGVDWVPGFLLSEHVARQKLALPGDTEAPVGPGSTKR